MKSIENKTTTINKADAEQNIIGKSDYSDLIKIVIGRGKQGGFTWDDIENRTAINNALKDVNGVIELEDANFKYLKELVKATTWAFSHEDLLAFREDIMAVK